MYSRTPGMRMPTKCTKGLHKEDINFLAVLEFPGEEPLGSIHPINQDDEVRQSCRRRTSRLFHCSLQALHGMPVCEHLLDVTVVSSHYGGRMPRMVCQSFQARAKEDHEQRSSWSACMSRYKS